MCYFLYITLYNTCDNIKPFGYCVHYGPKIFGGAGPLLLFIRRTIKQKVLIMTFQIRMCFLVCINIPGAGCISFKHNDRTTRIQFVPGTDSILCQYVHIKSKPHLSSYLTGSSDFFPRYKRTKRTVLKQEDNINMKPYLSANNSVSTNICTSSNKLNLLNCLQPRLKTKYIWRRGGGSTHIKWSL